MKRDDRMLWLAGGLAVGSLLLSTAALTIAIIAAASPPVSKFPSATLDAALASASSSRLIAASLSLLVVLWMLAQTIARRPIPMWCATAGGRSVSRMVIAIMAAFAVVLTAFSAYSVTFTITRAILPSGQPLTDNMAFGGLALGLGTPSIMWAMLSNILFLRWWQGAIGQGEHTPAPLATVGAA